MTWLCRKRPSCVEFALEKKKLKGDLLHDVLRAGLERKFAYVRGTGRVVSINSLLFGPRFPDFSTRATHNEGLLCTCGSRSSLRLFNTSIKIYVD